MKFIRFERLPKILFLQLNRFEYDPIYDTRKKIFDKVSFPLILNMNDFNSYYDKLKTKFTDEEFKKLENRVLSGNNIIYFVW